MPPSGAAWVALIWFAVFAGCVGSDATPAGSSSATLAPPPEAGSDTGSIGGQVMDDEARPIAAAVVVLLRGNAEAQTDEAGRFTFNEVAPGQQELYVQRLGYEAAGRKVEVRAGEVTEVTFTLKSMIVDREWHYTETTARDMIAGSYVSAYPNDVQTWSVTWTLKDDPYALGDLILEADWNPSTALGDGIRFWAGINTWNSGQVLCRSAGHDPYQCRVPQELIQQDWACDFRDDPKSCRAGWMFRPGGSAVTAQHVGLWPQDKVTVYISHFFRHGAPSDFTALK